MYSTSILPAPTNWAERPARVIAASPYDPQGRAIRQAYGNEEYPP
nr:hypothetical protein [Mesorhizobium ciceri]